MLWRSLGVASLLVVLAAAPPAAAEAPQTLVDRARLVVEEMRQDTRINSADLLSRARAVMIVPELSKGGFLVGGQGGTGLLLVKDAAGGWSAPVFYSIGGATLGLQVGFQTAKLVFFVMSDAGLQAWLRGEFKFGGQDGVAVFMHGTEVSGSGKTAQGADVIAWARASGAYAGITVEGTDVSFNVGENRAYYGRIVSAQEIIGGAAANAGAEALRSALR
jgi:lipid-binding SYLF domain-containing protein